jgi:hypothetical protein
MLSPNEVNLDVREIINFLYVAGGVVAALLLGLVGIAWRAGGDVREIKIAVREHGPAIAEIKAENRTFDRRLTILETKAGPEPVVQR